MSAGARPLRLLAMFGMMLVILAGCRATTVERPGTPAGSGGSSTPAPGRERPVTVTGVKLDLLKGDSTESPLPGRNPFRFVEKAAPPPPPSAIAPPRPAVVAPPVPTGPPPPPPIPLKFIGVLEATRPGKVALLADGRGNVSYGKEGDIIEGRYQVLKIGTESVDLAYADGRGRQTIRLSGQ